MRNEETIAEEAAEWWMNRRASGADHRAAFISWLDADPRHGKAFEAIDQAWNAFEPAAEDALDVDVLCDDAIADAKRQRQSFWQRPATRRGMLAGVAASAAAAFVLWRLPVRTSVEEFETKVGQASDHKLADGTRIQLDANSKIRVALRGKTRKVDLIRGEALFDVAHDAHRPFLVNTPDASVRVVGTWFAVEYRDQNSVVTLARGQVQVTSLHAKTTPVTMEPGDRYSVSAETSPQLSKGTDTAKAFAWKDGRLFFENETLERVVTRLNDYNATPIRVVDERVAGLKISGTYQVGRTTEFLHALQIYYRLTISEANGVVTIRSRT